MANQNQNQQNDPLQGTPEGWRPEDGAVLEGRVIELSRNWSDFQNDYYPVITIEQANGERTAVHAFHATLKNALIDKQPHIGDRVIITYYGKRPTRDGRRTVAVYTLETPDRQQDAGAFWQTLAAIHAMATASRPEQSPPAQSSLPGAGAEDDIPF